MSVKALLDDVAAEATSGLRIDVAAARRRADERRARARWRASATMASVVAVAAVIALVAVVLPAGGWLHRSTAVLPGDGNVKVGLPDQWFGLNSWAPSLSRAKLPAASMVLAGSNGPQLVSADGSRYARLPWSSGAQQVALSADGRDVAWVTPGKAAGGKDGPVIHRLRLPDAHDHRTTLPAGASQQSVRQVIWAGQQLYVVSGGRTGAAVHTWRLSAVSGPPVSVCECGTVPLGVDAVGRLIQQPADETTGPALPGVAQLAAQPDRTERSDDTSIPPMAPLLVVDPSGQRTASVSATALAPAKLGVRTPMSFDIMVSGSPQTGPGKAASAASFPVTGADQITDVRLLGWSNAGLIVRVRSLKRGGLSSDNVSIRLMAPDGTSSRVISRAAFRGFEPIAVAPDVVGIGVTVPGREPHFSSTDRAHLSFLFWRAWYLFGSRATAVLLVVLGLGAVLLARRRWRTRSWRAGEED